MILVVVGARSPGIVVVCRAGAQVDPKIRIQVNGVGQDRVVDDIPYQKHAGPARSVAVMIDQVSRRGAHAADRNGRRAQADAVQRIAEVQVGGGTSPNGVGLDACRARGTGHVYPIASIAADHVALARRYPTDLRFGRVRYLDPVARVAQRRRAIRPNPNLVVENHSSRRPRDHDAGARVAGDDIPRSGRGPADGIRWRSDDRYSDPIRFGMSPCRGDPEIIARNDVAAIG